MPLCDLMFLLGLALIDLFCLIFSFYIFVDLFHLTNTIMSSVCWFTAQMAATARAGSGRFWERGTSSGSPAQMAGAQVCGPATFPGV